VWCEGVSVMEDDAHQRDDTVDEINEGGLCEFSWCPLVAEFGGWLAHVMNDELEDDAVVDGTYNRLWSCRRRRR
jgi:hypothetical protein